MNATVPLEEALPFSSSIARSILVCDSIETDASFLLHSFVTQALKQKNTCVWWLTAKSVTEGQIATGLKRMGSDVAATYLRGGGGGNDKTPSLKISSLATEISSQISADVKDANDFDGAAYLKSVYRQIKEWVATDDNSSCCKWIILDDVSSLASLLQADAAVYKFVDSIQSLANRSQNLGLMVRCSLELDQMVLKQKDQSEEKTGWLGAGGLAYKEAIKREESDWIPWERSMGSMDIVVDVVPLSSGYSREAHGRLVFTECPGGRGWDGTSTTSSSKSSDNTRFVSPLSSSSSWNKFVINYCLQDTGVRAIRLRGSSATTM